MPRLNKLHIGIPNYRGIMEMQSVFSLTWLMHHLGAKGVNVQLTMPTFTIVSTARQYIVNQAINDPECSHVLFIDDDMVFGPEHVEMLISEAEKDDLDFVGALAFSNSIPTKPCVFGIHPDLEEDGEHPWWHIVSDYPKNKRFKVYAAGFGMVLVSKRMLQEMAEGDSLYQHFSYNHRLCPNEDVAFCLNARKKGYELYVDSRVSIGHISKDRPVIRESVYESQGKEWSDLSGLMRMEFEKGLKLRKVSSDEAASG